MGVNNYGLGMIGSYIRGLNPNNMDYVVFDNGSGLFQKDTNYAENEKYRKSGVWGPLELVDSRITVIIDTTELNGSYISATGLAVGSTALGSDMGVREIIAFGEKTQYQNWILNFDWRNRSA